jgi:hypothetical protein
MTEDDALRRAKGDREKHRWQLGVLSAAARPIVSPVLFYKSQQYHGESPILLLAGEAIAHSLFDL